MSYKLLHINTIHVRAWSVVPNSDFMTIAIYMEYVPDKWSTSCRNCKI